MKQAAFGLVATGMLLAQSAAPPLTATTEMAKDLGTRMAQLMESTAVSTPGLVPASEPLRRNTEQTVAALQKTPKDPGLMYRLMKEGRAYLALSDSVPRPESFPVTAEQQLAELREAVERLGRLFETSLTAPDESAKARDSDPAGLRRYAEENSHVPAVGKSPRVVFLGDATIENWRLNEYFTGRDFLNRGIADQLALQMIGRFLADVVALRPRGVVIMAGGNDIARGLPAGAVEDHLAMLGSLARAHGIRPMFASVLAGGDYQALNRWLEQHCAREGFGYLNFYKALADASGKLSTDLSDDGIHPNAKGYRALAPVLVDGLSRTLGPMDAPDTGAPAKRRFGLHAR